MRIKSCLFRKISLRGVIWAEIILLGATLQNVRTTKTAVIVGLIKSRLPVVTEHVRVVKTFAIKTDKN